MIVIIEDNPKITLEELCHACAVTPEFIQEIIEYGVLNPEESGFEQDHFTTAHLQRVRTVVRLQRDLQVNLAGAALALDLMEQLEKMRAKVELLERFFK